MATQVRFRAGIRLLGATGIVGADTPQVPTAVENRVVSYCESQDLVCGGGDLSALVVGVAREILSRATAIEGAHSLYLYKAMYDAAARYLRSRYPLGLLPKVDGGAGMFAGIWEGTAGCGYAERIGYGDPKQTFYLTLTVSSANSQRDNYQTTERLAATLQYDQVKGSSRTFLASASLQGDGTDGLIRLDHVAWLGPGRATAPIGIRGKVTYVVLEDKPIREAKKVAHIESFSRIGDPNGTDDPSGCFYMLYRRP